VRRVKSYLPRLKDFRLGDCPLAEDCRVYPSKSPAPTRFSRPRLRITRRIIALPTIEENFDVKKLIGKIICASLLSAATFAQNMPTIREQNGGIPAQSQVTLAQASETSNPGAQTSTNFAEKKLKGCLLSEGGKYVLQERRGRSIALAGSQELGSHVGHTVMARGTFLTGDVNNHSSSTASRQIFAVSKLDMVSDSCGFDKTRIAQQTFDANGKPSPYHK
jgi:hypothetical protein